MTKRVKVALVLLTAVASMNLHAQKKAITKNTKPATENKASKPTKKETMDWIAGKMKENLSCKLADCRHFVSYDNGIFTYKKEAKINEWYHTSIDLNNVIGMNNVFAQDFYVTGKKIVKTVLEGKEYGSTYDYLSVSGPNYEDYSAPFNFTPDQSLVERLKKAFITLIEYNATKKGENESF